MCQFVEVEVFGECMLVVERRDVGHLQCELCREFHVQKEIAVC